MIRVFIYVGLAVIIWPYVPWIVFGGLGVFVIYCVLAAIWHDYSRLRSQEVTPTYTFNPPPYPDLDANWNVSVNKYLKGHITADELEAVRAEHRNGNG